MIVTARQWMKAAIALQGGRRNAAAFVFGFAAALTMAPFFVFPLVLIAYGGLFLLVHKAPNKKRAFADGWWWGWGFYIAGLYWFCVALMTDMAAFGWMIPFTLFGVTAFIALYPALASLVFYTIPGKRGTIRRIIIFSVLWTCVEFARGHLLTGFPWNIPGNAFAFSDKAIQLASVFGAYGLSFWAVLLGASWAALHDDEISWDRSLGFTLAVWGCFVGGMAYGEYRLEQADARPKEERYVPGVMLRLVQANISQPHKWDPAKQMEGLQRYIQMTQSSGLSQVTHVIWPETAVPYVVRADTPLMRMLGSSLPEKTKLITGMLRAEGQGKDWKIWNSMMLLDHKGTLRASYDKSKLVPFGEFLPGRQLIPKSWLTPVGDTDFSRGPGIVNIELDGLPPARPMICYEVIFPEWGATAENETVKNRPAWFLNITNDAWFGKSSGPYQHFNMARMRAAENGIPLVRVANTGISGVVDPYGRIDSQLPLGQQGILDSKLPEPLPNTIYSAVKYYILPVLILICLILVVI
jgi:apolipoprotein N-acyltransferase